MKKPICSLLCVVGCLLVASQVEAGVLFGHHIDDGTPADRGSLYRIDTAAQSVTLVGTDPARPNSGPEIQLDASGTTIFFSPNPGAPGGGDTLLLIDPSTGLNTGSLPLSGMPVNGAGELTDAVTAMETVGSTLYGSFHNGGPEDEDGILGTINTTTGAITTIGQMTGIDRPTGGMHLCERRRENYLIQPV